MTLVVLFHPIRYRQFKSFYLHHVCQHLRAEFPTFPSYSRCIELLTRCAMALYAFFDTVKGECSGFSIVDSTPLAVCDKHRGELLSIRLTRGNGDDRKPLPDLVTGLFGQLYADKGDISNTLLQQLKEKGGALNTRVRRNMKP